MHQPSTPSVQVVPTRRRRGFNKKPAAAASLITCLPRDVLASILLGLPASDLRRFRRVCKEWRDTISDPVFIGAHMVHGPRAPTHTVVFYPGQHSGDKEPLNGGGFLFDEQWRLTARFTVDESVDMIGTCKGLLCFRDKLQGVINVVEPFDGQSITLPLPSSQGAAGTCSTRAYCFGFDAAARRYKMVYVAFDAAATTSATQELQELRVFVVGVDKDWRAVCFSCAAHGLSYDFPACGGNGGVYWHSKTADGTIKNVRFDLATESITSAQGRVDGRRPEGRILCSSVPWVSHRFVIGIKWFGEWEDGSWPGNVNAVAHDVYVPAPLPEGLRLPGPHALQRGHLILQDKDGDLRAQTINGSRGSYLYVWLNVGSKPLVEIGSKDEDPIPAERNQFVPVRGRHWPTKEPAPIGSNSKVQVPIVGRLPREQCDTISTFAYIPTVAPTPFAIYLGTPLQDLREP